VLRSALFHAKTNGLTWHSHLGKVVFVSSPDGGSYIEKLGYIAALIMKAAPVTALKILGIIGDLRSDAIKDLSHGVIRRQEPWKDFHVSRYFQDQYHGELEGVDAYQFYSIVAPEENSILSYFGDGIIESPSLEYLTKRVFERGDKKRSFLFRGKSHFDVIGSPEFLDILDGLITEL
jgi:hypothetical protein